MYQIDIIENDQWDERLCVHCEAGRMLFPDREAIQEYTKLYCTDAVRWGDCSLAAVLLHYYERMDNNAEC